MQDNNNFPISLLKSVFIATEKEFDQTLLEEITALEPGSDPLN